MSSVNICGNLRHNQEEIDGGKEPDRQPENSVPLIHVATKWILLFFCTDYIDRTRETATDTDYIDRPIETILLAKQTTLTEP